MTWTGLHFDLCQLLLWWVTLGKNLWIQLNQTKRSYSHASPYSMLATSSPPSFLSPNGNKQSRQWQWQLEMDITLKIILKKQSKTYLEPWRGAKEMVRGATKQPLRVQTPPPWRVLVGLKGCSPPSTRHNRETSLALETPVFLVQTSSSLLRRRQNYILPACH